MAHKHKDALPAKGKPVLKVVERRMEEMAPPAPPDPVGAPLFAFRSDIFADPRSGRDRRLAKGPTHDPRRVNGERRRGSNVRPWWLEKNYVDAHYFSP